jgi:long-chain acyl-CoA synthetase
VSHLSQWAASDPDKPAVIMGRTGARQTYRELDEGSNRLAHFLRTCGLAPGHHYSVLAENHQRYLEVCAAGERAGLHYTPVNHHLTADEVAYILRDSGAEVLVTTTALHDLAAEAVARASDVAHVLVLDSPGSTAPSLAGGFRRYDEALADLPSTPIDDEQMGSAMFYSSGTTGRPKGVKRRLSGVPPETDVPHEAMFRHLYGCTPADIYLSPAPMFHATPVGFCQVLHRLGATVVVMERFDALEALREIEAHGVTFASFVPTMFVRMLKLPDADRRRYDLSSLRIAVHTSEPCAIQVKERMLEWWGPMISEYYGGSEANGITYLTASEWLEHRGSVGRSLLGRATIVDDAGRELPTGETGNVYFVDGADFEYHNDPAKTAEAGVGTGRTTIGDVGYLDDDGYLYLTDRKSYTIISGGVNVYPQEVEHALILHPAVADVAVFGIPDDDMGEQVKAVVQPAPGVDAGPALAADLIEHCRARLAHFKCPRSIDFIDQLPRLDTGKLYKRELRDPYWVAPRGSALVPDHP